VRYGIAAADAYRSERLQLEGLTKVRNWYGLAAGKAEDLQNAIDSVSGSSAVGREEVNGMAVSLYRMNMRGVALTQALEGLATVQSAAGEEQRAFYQQLYVGAARSGVAIKKVSDDIKARFGGVAAAQMLSLGVQSKKLKENFNALFRGVKVEAFLTALKSVTDLFSQNTASGRALKQILEVTMQPLIDGISTLGPIAKRFFQGMILAAQDITIAYYNVRLAFKGAFGDTKLIDNIDLTTVALNLGKIAVYSMAIGVGLLTAGLLLLASPFLLVGYQAYKFADSVMGAYKVVKAIEWSELGAALIDGFVGGITRGIGKVVNAVKGVGKAALETLRKALDSHSPSRKGATLGLTYPQGVGGGIEDGIPTVQKAARRVGIVIDKEAKGEAAGAAAPRFDGGQPPPAAGAFGGSVGSSNRGSAGAAAPSITIHAPLTLTIESKGGDGDDITEKVREICEQHLQHVATAVAQSLGAA
jgi:hypothetical protein